ncbi:hypothetical protein AC249_AIPGENE10520 [Exaiptasia diaphana]|nr:hypothetical protein AC249_AIPGENE25059 [Exaiptasia diaphana]KXJ23184.1 hypothetical protein AC249_AIPGENE10520 [Exaiptasia diaphana]
MEDQKAKHVEKRKGHLIFSTLSRLTAEEQKFQKFIGQLKKALESKNPEDGIKKALELCETLKKMVCPAEPDENAAKKPSAKKLTTKKGWLIRLAENILKKPTHKEYIKLLFMSEQDRLASILCKPKIAADPNSPSKKLTIGRDVSYDESLSFLVQRKKRSLKTGNEKRARPLPGLEMQVGEKGNDDIDKDGEELSRQDDSDEFEFSTVVPPGIANLEKLNTGSSLTTTTLGVDGQFDEAIVIDPNHPDELLDRPNDEPKSTHDGQDEHDKNPPSDVKRVILEQSKVPLDDLLDADEEPLIEKKSGIPDSTSRDESLDASKDVMKEETMGQLDDDVPIEKPKVGREIKYEEDDES